MELENQKEGPDIETFEVEFKLCQEVSPYNLAGSIDRCTLRTPENNQNFTDVIREILTG